MTTPDANRRVLAFLAHPDDAEGLCAGTLIRLAELGWDIHIATVTAGDCGTVTETPWAIAAIRTQEAKEAAAQISATYHCLGELDGLIVFDRPAIQKSIDLFRRVAPALVFTHAPKDYSMDHEMTCQLARAASFMYATPNISEFPLRESSEVPYLYYCDPVEGIDPLGNAIEPTTLVDITRQLERKIQMLSCHASQRQWLQQHHGIDEYLDSAREFSFLRGRLAGVAAAEGFVQHRGPPYPRDDLLKQCFTET